MQKISPLDLLKKDVAQLKAHAKPPLSETWKPVKETKSINSNYDFANDEKGKKLKVQFMEHSLLVMWWEKKYEFSRGLMRQE